MVKFQKCYGIINLTPPVSDQSNKVKIQDKQMHVANCEYLLQ